MKLKPFAEVIAMSKEERNKDLAPVRAQKMKMQAALESAKIDEQIVTLESEVQEMCAQKEINFELLIAKIDKAAILERRKKQYAEIVGQLFPAE